MTTYKYKGQSLSGARVSGVVRAYDEFEAVAKLRDTCAFITKIEPVKERGNALDKPIGFRLKDKELALLCSQFSIILTSGLSVMRCVEMVASQTRNKYTRRMLEKVAEEVGAGYSLAQSFESNAPYLPATFIETVRAGEESGTLALCARLHRYYERTAKTRAKIISTMTYPAMVIVVAIIVFIIIIAVAVPAFTDAFADLGEGELPDWVQRWEPTVEADSVPDFADVMGQENVKRALEIAAAGSHNVLLIGSPGAGKSMLARRLPSILPDMTHEEALESTEIWSVAGLTDSKHPMLTQRPFRSPHHTLSAAAMSGGGRALSHGEISLAHHGVLQVEEAA